MADDSEDATKLRSAISRAAAKNFTTKNPDVFDGMSTRQLFLDAQTPSHDRQQPFYTIRSAATGYRLGFIPGTAGAAPGRP